MNPKVSVIVATLNRESFLLETIGDLLKQDFDSYEIVIVDQSESQSQAVVQIAKSNSEKLTYHHVRFRGLPVARNFGWQKSSGDVLLFIDDDIRCSESLVREHFETMKDPKVGIVAGGVDEPNRDKEKNPTRVGTFSLWSATPKAGFQSKEPKPVQHAKGCNFSVRRELFSRVGGFDEALSLGTAIYEELEFCLRVTKSGYSIYFNPKARLTHLVAPDGGCRVPQLDRYLNSVSRNRAIIIQRNLSWYHKPFAFLRLLFLNLSYCRSQREPKALLSGVKGFFEGLKLGRRPPVVTTYE